MEEKINTEDCPRCGCWMVKHFVCGCGACDDWCCMNCGRYAAPALTRDQHTELTPAIKIGGILFPGDERCTLGPITHEHRKAAA